MAALDGEDRGIDADEDHIEPVSEEIGQGPNLIGLHGLHPFPCAQILYLTSLYRHSRESGNPYVDGPLAARGVLVV
jgi:hypothetical protein